MILIDQGKKGVLQLSDCVQDTGSAGAIVTVAEFLSPEFKSHLTPEQRLEKILAPHRDPRTKKTYGGLAVARSVKDYLGDKSISPNPKEVTRKENSFTRSEIPALTEAQERYFSRALRSAVELDEENLQKNLLAMLRDPGNPGLGERSERQLYRQMYQSAVRQSVARYHRHGKLAEFSLPEGNQRHAWAKRAGLSPHQVQVDDLKITRARTEGQLQLLYDRLGRSRDVGTGGRAGGAE